MKSTPARTKLGWITVVLAIATPAAFLKGADSLTQGALVRTLIEVGALYMAWPELVQLPKWLWGAVPVVVIVGAFRPQILIFAIPLFLLILYLTPKKRGK